MDEQQIIKQLLSEGYSEEEITQYLTEEQQANSGTNQIANEQASMMYDAGFGKSDPEAIAAITGQYPQEAQPVSATDIANSVGNTALPYNNQIVSGLSSVLRKPEGMSIPDAYDMYLQNIKEDKARFSEEHPVVDTLASVAGGVISPLNRINFAGKLSPLLSKPLKETPALMQGVREGINSGLVGGIYASEDAKDLGDLANKSSYGALAGALLGGGTAATMGKIGNTQSIENMADELERSAVGIRKRDYKDMLLRGEKLTEEGANSLDKSIKTVTARGTFDKVKDAKGALVANEEMMSKIAKEEIDPLITELDRRRGAAKYKPKWDNLERLIKNTNVTERAKVRKEVEDIIPDLNKAFDGSFQSMQKEKQKLYSVVYKKGDKEVPESIRKAISKDLKESIERAASRLPKSKEGTDLGEQLRSINNKYAEHATLRNMLNDQYSSDAGRNIFKKIQDAIPSPIGKSGAVGLATTALTQNPLLGLAVALGGSQLKNPQMARRGASALRNVKVQKSGDYLNRALQMYAKGNVPMITQGIE